MESARVVAEATGGFFGLGNKISKPERLVIAELEQTMSYTVRMWPYLRTWANPRIPNPEWGYRQLNCLWATMG